MEEAKKVFTKFYFSTSVIDIVEAFSKMHKEEGAEAPEAYRTQLVKAVMDIPRKGFDVEASDNAISFAGVKLSWLKDWKSGEIHIMTLEEAKALDAECNREKEQKAPEM